MNEEKPKSIWKKSWKGPRGLLLWLIPFTLVFAVIYANDDVADSLKNYLGLPIYALFFSLFVMLMLLLVIRFVRWLFCWRNFKRFLFGCACLATLIALFYAEEDWRGKHDWGKFKRESEAKGEHFDFASAIPPPVPDDQNFAMSPVWIAEVKYTFLTQPQRAESWYGDRIYSAEVSKIVSLLPVSVGALVGTNWAYRLPETPEVLTHWSMARMTDLKPWQSYYRVLERTNPAAEIPIAPQPQSSAADVLLALIKYDSVVEELRTDSALPYSRFPIRYDDEDKASILLPHLDAVKRYAQVLQLRAIAELQNGESDQALADVKLMLRLTDSIHTEPFIISHLDRIAVLNLTLQPIWEGLAEQKWSDEQLLALDSELVKLDFLTDYRVAMRGERALALGIIEFLRHSHNRFRTLSNLSGDGGNDSPDGLAMVLFSFGPSGWLDQNELRISQFYSQWYLPAVNEQDKIVFPATVRNADAAFGPEFKHRSQENLLESMILPSLGGFVKKIAYAQSSVNLARVAIALERYRLARGKFPESLDVLASQFMAQIPHDIINGQPLHYRRISDGQFILYSVGWNETDDGGVVVLKKGKTPEVDRDEGDWVWRYPSK